MSISSKSVIVYHASPCKIELFTKRNNGIHMGSLYSALQAVQRKNVDEVYIHKLKLNTENIIENFPDAGDDWLEVIEYLEENEKTVLSYKNQYEPSIYKSYLCIDPKEFEVLEITHVNATKVELMISDFEMNGEI